MRRRKGKTSDTAAIRRSTAKTMRSASSTRPGTTTIMSTTLAPYARKARQLSRHATRLKKRAGGMPGNERRREPEHHRDRKVESYEYGERQGERVEIGFPGRALPTHQLAQCARGVGGRHGGEDQHRAGEIHHAEDQLGAGFGAQAFGQQDDTRRPAGRRFPRGRHHADGERRHQDEGRHDADDRNQREDGGADEINAPKRKPAERRWTEKLPAFAEPAGAAHRADD